MGNFNDRRSGGGGFRGGNRSGGRSNFGGNRRDGDRREVSMHKAVCDKCHKSCEVPFRPSNDKPIYCNDCFGDKRGNEAPRRDFKNRDSNRDFDSKKQNFSKPSFEKSLGDDIKKQLSDISTKLDRLISLFEKTESLKISSATISTIKPTVKKAEKKTSAKVVEKKIAPKKVSVKKTQKQKK